MPPITRSRDRAKLTSRFFASAPQDHTPVRSKRKAPSSKSSKRATIKTEPTHHPIVKTEPIEHELLVNVDVKLRDVKIPISIVKSEAGAPTPSSSSESKKPKTTTTKKKRAKKKPVTFKTPPNWRSTWDLVKLIRDERNAPVDYIGCDQLPDSDSPEPTRQYQALISLMLSSQTKDQVTAHAMTILKKHGCTVDNILATSPEALSEMICKVGFYNRKTDYILRATKMIKEDFNGEMPDTIEKVTTLPGVGPKMGYLYLTSAFGITTGIGVDTHVHRISNQLNWCKTTDPEQTRLQLESWLPFELWSEINILLVGVGQMIQQLDERPKLLRRCVRIEDEPTRSRALRLVKKLGLKVEAEADKIDLLLPKY